MFPKIETQLILNTTPIIIDQHKKVRIVLNKIDSNQNSELSFDGQENIDIKEGSSIEISKSKEEVSLIHPLDNEYFFGCRSKLGWGKSILEWQNVENFVEMMFNSQFRLKIWEI